MVSKKEATCSGVMKKSDTTGELVKITQANLAFMTAAGPTILLTTAENALPSLTQNRRRSNYGKIYHRNR